MIFAEIAEPRQPGDGDLFSVMFTDLFQRKFQLFRVLVFQLRTGGLLLFVRDKSGDCREQTGFQEQLISGRRGLVDPVHLKKQIEKRGISMMIRMNHAWKHKSMAADRR